MGRAILLIVLAGCAFFGERMFEPGLRCLYVCEPGGVLDGARRGVSVLVVLGVSGMWGALCARLTRGHPILVPLLSISLCSAAVFGLLTPSPRVFGAIGGMAALGFSVVRWDLLWTGQSEGDH